MNLNQETIYLSLGAVLLVVGILIMMSKQHLIFILIGIELIFNAANLNLIAFYDSTLGESAEVFALFIILVAVCETAVALAIILQVYKTFKTVKPNEIATFKG